MSTHRGVTSQRNEQDRMIKADTENSVTDGSPSKSPVPPTPQRDLPRLLDEMRETDADITQLQLGLIESRVLLKNTRKRRADLLRELESVAVRENELISRQETVQSSIQLQQVKLKGLRFWGQDTKLTDLPDELLPFIFVYLGYSHQQRLLRVCRLWKRIITCDVDHVYVEPVPYHIQGMNDRFICGPFRPGVTGAGGMLRQCRGVRQLTCSGWCSFEFYTVLHAAGVVADAFPKLSVLNVVQALLCPLSDGLVAGQVSHFVESHLGLHIALRECLVRPVQVSFILASAQLDLRLFARGLDEYYVPVPDLAFTGLDALGRVVNRAVWPYPPEQADWLASNVPRMNSSTCLLMKGLLKVFHGTMGVGRLDHSFTRAGNRPCPEHGQFCGHLDGAFYMEQLDGQARNLLAHCLLDCRIPGVPAPPVAFDMQAYSYDAVTGRRAPAVKKKRTDCRVD